MLDVLIVLVMIVLCIGLVIVITTFMTKRAMHQVIRIFAHYRAVDPQSAKAIAEMHLNPPSFRERLMKMRDYKPKALQLLMSMHIVQQTEDGRVFLDEKKLRSSNLTNRWPSLAREMERR